MATKKVSPHNVDRAAQARIAFIRSVKFGGLGLDEVSASVDRAALAAVGGGRLSAEVSIKQELLSHDLDNFVVQAKFTVIEKQEVLDTPVVSVKATFSARFELAEKASKEAVEAFAHLEARLIFFPYIRHFISDITYRMSINPIVLPMTSELENRGN